eukprot:403366184
MPRFGQLIVKQNSQSEIIEETFRKICQSSGNNDHNSHLTVLKNLRINKQLLKQYLSRRYKKQIADKIINFLDSSNQNFHNLDIYHYLKIVDDMIHGINQNFNSSSSQVNNKLLDLTFSVFDIGSKGRICEHDVFQIMSFFNSSDNYQHSIFMNAFSDDLSQVARAINWQVNNFQVSSTNLQSDRSKYLPNLSKNTLTTPTYLNKKNNKIEKLNSIISALQSANNSPKGLIKSESSTKKQNTIGNIFFPQKQDNSLHGQFQNSSFKCESITKQQFLQQVIFPSGVSCIADDIIKYLTGIGIKSYIQSEKKRINKSNNLIRETTIQKLAQVSIKQLKQKFNSFDIEKLESSFYKLSTNPIDKNAEISFINQESFVNNFSSIFIYDNKNIANRIFQALTGFLPQQRIYLEQFLEKMYPLLNGGLDYKNKFAYYIYDKGNKGSINSIDLEEFFTKILPCQLSAQNFHSCQCPFYQEVKLLSDEYVKNNIIQWSQKSKVLINYDYFRYRLGMSCLYQEFIDRLLQKPQSESIFIGYSHQIDNEKLINLPNNEELLENDDSRPYRIKQSSLNFKDKSPASLLAQL